MKQCSIRNPLVCFGDLLQDWVIKNPEPVELKDRKTRRYILANSQVASLFGMTMNEVVGLDVKSLGKANRLKPSFVERINEMDYQVIHKRQVVRFKHVFFTHSQTILVEEITKQPIFGHQKEVVAILNHARDITLYIDLHTLFWHYQDLYCRILKKRQSDAIAAFLRHLKIDGFFMKTPTLQECEALLVMRKFSQTKYMASELGIETKTVDNHKANLRQKLKTPDFCQLLSTLRTHHEHSIFE